MGTRYLIDTNVVIGYLDNKLPESGMLFVSDIIDDASNLSVVTKIELLRFNTSVTSYAVLNEFIAESTVLGLTELVVNHTITICKPRKIKLPDAIIAATAIAFDLTLVTRNITDFKGIGGLQLFNPWELK